MNILWIYYDNIWIYYDKISIYYDNILIYYDNISIYYGNIVIYYHNISYYIDITPLRDIVGFIYALVRGCDVEGLLAVGNNKNHILSACVGNKTA